MTKRNTTQAKQEHRRTAEVKLDSRYGAIGISAVAAALQFKSEFKNSTETPAISHDYDERFADNAA